MEGGRCLEKELRGPEASNEKQRAVKGVSSEEAGSTGLWFLPGFRNGNSVKDANSLGGRWLRREQFQSKCEHCIESSGRKNLVFFKVLGMRSRRWGEREKY